MEKSKNGAREKKQRKWEPDPNMRSKDDRLLVFFTEAMIEKIESVQNDWQKPWFSGTFNRAPRNLDGRYYNGKNSLILMIQAERKGYSLPVWMTFDRALSLNYTKDKQGKVKLAVGEDGKRLPSVSVKKGEKSTPVVLRTFNVVNRETKERIKYEDYIKLDKDEKLKYRVYPKERDYQIFNIDQTNIKEARPELYDKLLEKISPKAGQQQSGEDKTSTKAIDTLIDNGLWMCPIKQVNGDSAYYSPSLDEIVVPERSQFRDGESFATNTLHEMAHSTGPRLGRDKEYGVEELIAELTAAFIAAKNGMEKHLKDDSASYLKSWLESLKKDPKFIMTVLNDVERADYVISHVINKVQESLDIAEGKVESADFSHIKEELVSFNKTGQYSSVAESVKETKEQEEQLSDEDKEKAETNGVDVDGNGEIELDESEEKKNKEHKSSGRGRGM